MEIKKIKTDKSSSNKILIEATKKYLTSRDLEEQEHLSKKQLEALEPKPLVISDPRPTANFNEIMDWVCKNFESSLQDKSKLNKFVHNKISIDGAFLRFCEENKISVECLYKDSVISWRTDNNFEKFFVPGVFLVKNKSTEFLVGALFHKGNSFEDEVSFFVVCANSSYEGYLEIRNQFDDWLQKRDRSNLFIRVVDGEDLSYSKDHSWNDLFLPPEMKNNIKNSVEGFLLSKEFYLRNKIPWKMGLLLYGMPGNGKTQLIKTLISEYDFKPVTIAPGAGNEAMQEAFSYAEEQSPSLLFFEDIDSMLGNNIDISSFLNLMDGISAKNGLFIVATANNIKVLKSSVTDRPSRFDRKYEIPLPTKEMSFLYLKKWFGDFVTDKKLNDLAKYAEQYKFSYAYLKELYISSMFEALSNNRKVPMDKDIKNALSRLVKDKLMAGGGVVSTDKYFK